MKCITGNYSVAGKRGHWPASEDTSLPYLTLPCFPLVSGSDNVFLYREH